MLNKLYDVDMQTLHQNFWIINKSYSSIRESIKRNIIVSFFSFRTLYCNMKNVDCVVLRAFRCLSAVQRTIFELERELCLRVACRRRKCRLEFDSRVWSIFQHVERIVNLTVNNLHYVDAALTRRWRHVSFRFCDNVRFSVTLFIVYLSIFRCIILFNVVTSFWDKVEKSKKMSAMYSFLD
jgi:hypothetical protein